MSGFGRDNSIKPEEGRNQGTNVLKPPEDGIKN